MIIGCMLHPGLLSALVIASGQEQRFADILITLGAVKKDHP
jgi:hypothetical protein